MLKICILGNNIRERYSILGNNSRKRYKTNLWGFTHSRFPNLKGVIFETSSVENHLKTLATLKG